MDNKDFLIKKQEEYIKLLGDEINKTASYLWIHGFITSEEDIQLGIKIRNEIQELKDKIENEKNSKKN